MLRARARRCREPSGLDNVPRWAGLPDIDDAGRWAVEAYVRTYGPTTADGVQYYLGAGLSAGRKALRGWLDDLSDRLVAVDIDGEDLLLFPDDVNDLTSTVMSPTVCLLPAADPWVMGPGTQTLTWCLLPHRRPVTRGANLVLVNGVVAGTWTRKAGTLSLAWFDDADPPDLNFLGQEAARLAATLDTELNLNVTAS